MNSAQLPTYNESFLIPPEHSSSIESETSEARFILARLEKFTYAFPSETIAGILLIDRAQILTLPLYDLAVVGIVHHSGKIVPLVSLRQLIGISGSLSLETITAIYLSSTANNLAGLGIVVDTTMGMCLQSDLPSYLFANDTISDSKRSESNTRLFQPELLPDRLWQPKRWVMA
jgi:hypothetical protein